MVIDLMASGRGTRYDRIVPHREGDNVTTTLAALESQARFGGVAASIQPAHVELGENARGLRWHEAGRR
jgi:hypothetical protein